MTVSSEILIEEGDWKIKKLFEDGEFSHHVINYEMENGRSASPFDEVHASGGLLELDYNGERSVTFTGVIDGTNTYTEDADMPKAVFHALKLIGPY